MTEDPRAAKAYRDQVVKELGFGTDSTGDDMTEADKAAVRSVLESKAAAFWLEGTPRTVLRHLMSVPVSVRAGIDTNQ